jgi:hypothetical protein
MEPFLPSLSQMGGTLRGNGKVSACESRIWILGFSRKGWDLARDHGIGVEKEKILIRVFH